MGDHNDYVAKKTSGVIRVFLLILIIGSLLLASYALRQKTSLLNQAIGLSISGGPANPAQIPVRLMVVVYNPILPSKGNQRLNKFMGWNDPTALTNQMLIDLQSSSHDMVKYQIVKTVDNLNFPPQVNGQRYTDSLYLQEFYNNQSWTLGNGDWNAIISENNIDKEVNNGNVDEVFLWGAPGFGWPESAMAGNGAYWINGGPILGVNTKAFVIMGLNYERTVELAEHSYGHRVESIMRRVYGGWAPDEKTDWDKFTLIDKNISGHANCGNIHYPPNALSDYDYTDPLTVKSACDDWNNFPNFTGVTKDTSCSTWGCDQYGYMKWWHSHLPHVSGLKSGLLNNWWRYIADVDQFKANWSFLPEAANDLTENNSANWLCRADGATCTLTDDNSWKKIGLSSLKFTTTGAFDTVVQYPSSKGASWNLSDKNSFVFWAYAQNNNLGFQNYSPIVLLKDASGNSFRYQPATDLMSIAVNQWVKFVIPLAGDTTWTRTTSGNPILANIDRLEIHNDTWGAGFTIYFDGLGFSSGNFTDTIPPKASITSPKDNAIVTGVVPVTVDASDNSAVFRVDLFVDGQYLATDAIRPYVFFWDISTIPVGTHTVSAVAYDAFANQSAPASITVAVGNRPPKANFSYTSVSYPKVVFTNNSTDPDGNALIYLWNFGDGTTSTDKNPIHIYPALSIKKIYNASLTVTDTYGAKDTIRQSITLP